MYNVLILDEKQGSGLDIDYLDDGRIIIDKLCSDDFKAKDEGKSWLVKKKLK